MMMSRVIGKKRQTMAMLCKIADVKMFIAQKEMAVRVKCADSNRRAHAVALVRAVVSDEIGTKITFQILSAAFDAIVAGEPIPAPDPANELAAKAKAKDAAKGGVMARLTSGRRRRGRRGRETTRATRATRRMSPPAGSVGRWTPAGSSAPS